MFRPFKRRRDPESDSHNRVEITEDLEIGPGGPGGPGGVGGVGGVGVGGGGVGGVGDKGRFRARDRRNRILKREEKKAVRKERKEKRRAFFVKLTSNIKWIMLAAAVIAVILFAKFGIPSLITGV
ncbi:hypothetical protein LCGC14_0673900 [marine sediment metagenome]|uniref:Uncharacterized protein n=1 Tax=marine sediment metagenome TaxID=412755 RepID=A0A0F9RAL3_9ZZZZ